MKDYPKNWSITSKKVREESNYTCSKCGRKFSKWYSNYLHTHHVKLISKGGKSYRANLRVLCYECHKKKHTKKLRYKNGKRVCH